MPKTWFSSWGEVELTSADAEFSEHTCKVCGEPMTLMLDPPGFYTCEPCNEERNEEREINVKSRKI